METVASLIREFPFGSFLIITGIIAGGVKVITTFINRNKPCCDCDCCGPDEEDDDNDDDDEDEGEGPALMGGQEED